MAIGFEFASNISVAPATAAKAFPKAARLSRGTGWQMVVDGNDVEFVLNPVEESDLGRSTLEMNVDMLVKFIDKLMAEFARKTNNPPQVRRSDLPSLFPNAPDFLLTYKYGSQPVSCIPQVTAGIRLGRMRKLMRVMSDPNSAFTEQFLGGGTDPAYRRFYTHRLGNAAMDHTKIKDPKWPAHTASAKLRGLVSLIVLYLMQGDAPAANAVKYLTFIMSRTKFSALFNELPQDERDHYRGAPEDWVQFLCTSMVQEAAGKTLDPNGKVIEARITDHGNLRDDKRASIPVKRREWLVGMTKGQDLLSAEAHPIEGAGKTRENVIIYKDSNAELGHRLRGLAALGDKMDDVTYGTMTERAAIVEFRARQKEVPLTRWKQYALDSFDFFLELNEGARDGALDFGGDDS